MSRSNLPEGVAPDNEPLVSNPSFSDGVTGAPDFTAPDIATPGFVRSNLMRSNATRPDAALSAHTHATGHHEIIEDDDKPIKLLPGGGMSVAIIIAIALLLLSFATVLYAVNNRQTMPLCSSQPEWNQYNCRAG